MSEFLHYDQIINYELCGAFDNDQRTPVLLLHGNGENMEVFSKLAPHLMNTKDLVFMDSRLHGRSYPLPGGDESLSYEAIADDALALMEHLGIWDYDVIGFSDGGIAALIMAMHSLNIRRVIAIGANIDPSGLTFRARRDIKREYKRACAAGDGYTAELMRLMLEEPHITLNDLAAIAAETTIVLGTRDNFISKKHSEQIADAIPHGSHVYIEGASHDIPRSYPAALAELIRTLL